MPHATGNYSVNEHNQIVCICAASSVLFMKQCVTQMQKKLIQYYIHSVTLHYSLSMFPQSLYLFCILCTSTEPSLYTNLKEKITL